MKAYDESFGVEDIRRDLGISKEELQRIAEIPVRTIVPGPDSDEDDQTEGGKTPTTTNIEDEKRVPY